MPVECQFGIFYAAAGTLVLLLLGYLSAVHLMAQARRFGCWGGGAQPLCYWQSTSLIWFLEFSVLGARQLQY